MISVLVILPAIIFVSSIYIDVVPFLVEGFTTNTIEYKLAPLIQYVIIAVMLVVYPISPLLYSVELYFKKMGPHNVLAEYHNLKKIAIILFPVFVFALFHLIVLNIIGKNPVLDMFYVQTNSIFFYLLTIALGIFFFVFASILLRLIFLTVRKDFGYFLAKESIKLLIVNQASDSNLGNLVKIIDRYNAYVRRKTGFEIKDLQNIYSRILADSNFNNEELIYQLRKSFEHPDKLKPISYFSKNLDITNPENFLVKVSIKKKFQNYVTWLLTILSALTATFSGLFPHILNLL